MQKYALLTLSVLCMVVLVSVALADGSPSVHWRVIGGGGGHLEQGIYSLDNTLGQPVVGRISNGSYELCAGFWCGAEAEYTIFLPLVFKNV